MVDWGGGCAKEGLPRGLCCPGRRCAGVSREGFLKEEALGQGLEGGDGCQGTKGEGVLGGGEGVDEAFEM